jgi:hypothetical protein
MALKAPTGELVAVAYGKLVLAAAGQGAVPVVTNLPDVSVWTTTGALQVAGIVGTVSRETPVRDMVVSYDGWAARPASDRPPYGQANGILQTVWDSGFQGQDVDLPLALEPAGVYRPVRVASAFPITEPRRAPVEDASRAHFTLDFRLIWMEVA